LESAAPGLRASAFANLRRQGYGGQAASARQVAALRRNGFQGLEPAEPVLADFSKHWKKRTEILQGLETAVAKAMAVKKRTPLG
jgi:hypothetical protein